MATPYKDYEISHFLPSQLRLGKEVEGNSASSNLLVRASPAEFGPIPTLLEVRFYGTEVPEKAICS